MANLTSVGLTAGAATSGTGTVSTIDNIIGTAGTASAQVLSVQGIASGTPQIVTVGDGTNSAAIKAASTAPIATDKALVVAISPNSVNTNGQATMANSAPVAIASNQSSVKTVTGGSEYETIAVSQTDQVMGATGATGDYIEGILCVVATAATSQVQIKDGSGSAITVLPNAVGAGVGTYYVPLGLISTSGAWKVTTAAGVTAIGMGDFT